MIRSDTLGVMSDLETIASDLVAADLVIDKIYSDTGNIRAQEIEILSDLETIKSDIVVLMSDTGTDIMSDLEVVMSDIVVLMSDTGKIYSDTGNIRADITEIYSDTVETLSDLETIKSDIVVLMSDTGDILSDTLILTATNAAGTTGVITSDITTSDAVVTVVSISDIGVLTGVMQRITNEAAAATGTLTVRIDAAAVITSANFSSCRASDMSVSVLPFNHRFATSLHITHEASVAANLATFVAYTTD